MDALFSDTAISEKMIVIKNENHVQNHEKYVQASILLETNFVTERNAVLFKRLEINELSHNLNRTKLCIFNEQLHKIG